MFLILFCSNSAHFSEIQLDCDWRTDRRTNRQTDCRTNRQTDRPTDPPTEQLTDRPIDRLKDRRTQPLIADTPSYRDTRTHLKMKTFFIIEVHYKKRKEGKKKRKRKEKKRKEKKRRKKSKDTNRGVHKMQLLCRHFLFILSFFSQPDVQTDQWTDILMSFLNCRQLSLGPCKISSSLEYRKWCFSSFENNTGQTNRQTDGLTDWPMDGHNLL